jgi:phosphoglycolate phosphatase
LGIRNLIFDLDGTLIDPWSGVHASLQQVFSELDLKLPPAEDLRWIVGPPIRESLTKILAEQGRETDLAAAHQGFRRVYDSVGVESYTVYAGAHELIESLHASGSYRLFIASSKPDPGPEKILTRMGHQAKFELIAGARPADGRLTKDDVLKHVLDRAGLKPTESVMIGDRYHDLRAAKALGVPAFGVLWGYGPHAELSAESPTALFPTIADLRSHLGR